MRINEINAEEARNLLNQKAASFLDIRDPQSFQTGHIPGAIHVSEEKAHEVIATWDKESPLVVYCYHGNTSYGVAGYFLEKGFKQVSSLAGGFEVWKMNGPVEV